MSRHRSRGQTLHGDVYRRLSGMLQAGMGRSRHEDKLAGVDGQYIYSPSTYQTYKREAGHFVDWMKQAHPECRTLASARPYADDYLRDQIAHGYSAWTIATRKAAVAKVLGINSADLIKTPPRERADIVRSRYAVKTDRHLSAQKRDYYEMIGCATGLRRRELESLRGTDLVPDSKGRPVWYLHVTRGTKGGKSRYAVIHGRTPEETARVVEIIRQAGPVKVCSKLPSAFDEHHCRAVYAHNLYNWQARPEEKIPPADRYWCRRDRAGTLLDRRAMLIVSRHMGHNRIDVIAEHYLF